MFEKRKAPKIETLLALASNPGFWNDEQNSAVPIAEVGANLLAQSPRFQKEIEGLIHLAVLAGHLEGLLSAMFAIGLDFGYSAALAEIEAEEIEKSVGLTGEQP